LVLVETGNMISHIMTAITMITMILINMTIVFSCFFETIIMHNIIMACF